MFAHDPGLGRRADRGAPLHARSSSRASTTSASRSTSASTRSARSRRRPSRRTSSTASATGSEPAAWARIEAARRVVAVGTTTTRVLETVARGGPLSGRSDLFITPGFAFRRVDALLTNFHLPRTTLLALVMAFAGIEETRGLYELAIRERYRFYSFGDAMLIL